MAGTDKTSSLHNTAETIHKYILKIQIVKKLQQIQNQLPLREQIWPKELMKNFSGTITVFSIKYSLYEEKSASLDHPNSGKIQFLSAKRKAPQFTKF